MSKKEYSKLAQIFKTNRPTDKSQYTMYIGILYSMMNVLKQDNPRFEEDQFLKAVGE